MKDTTVKILDELFERYPTLEKCRCAISAAVDMLLAAYGNGGKVLVCGNGGSASDAEHIVGELLKKFKKHRDVPESVAEKLRPELAAKLEGSLPAISLVSMSGIITAFANDVAWETAFAQQVLGLGKPGDVLIALSTSGNSANCVAAAEVMKAVGGKTIAFTGIEAFRNLRCNNSRSRNGNLQSAGTASSCISCTLRSCRRGTLLTLHHLPLTISHLPSAYEHIHWTRHWRHEVCCFNR